MSLRKLSRARSGAAIPALKHVPPQGYPDYLFGDRDLEALFASAVLKPTRKTCALLAQMPADAPLVGRYPMKDAATLVLQLGILGRNRDVQALRSMKVPELALYPGEGGWQVRLACEITRLTVHADWIPSDPSSFLARLIADGGILNAALSYPDHDHKKPPVRRGVRMNPIKRIWWPTGDVLSAKSHLRKVRAECIKIEPVVAGKVSSRPQPTHLMVDATLDDSPVKVRRLFRMSMTDTLDDLGGAMLQAFDWDGSHLSSFYVGRNAIANSDDEHENATPLSKLYDNGVRQLRFLYDFGDSWKHTLKLKPATPAQIADERWVQAAEGPDMLDDVGGTWGLQRVIEMHAMWVASEGNDRDDYGYSDLFEYGWRPDRNKWMG